MTRGQRKVHALVWPTLAAALVVIIAGGIAAREQTRVATEAARAAMEGR